MNKVKLKKLLEQIESDGFMEYIFFRPDLETLAQISNMSKEKLVLAIDTLKQVEYGLDEAEQGFYDDEDV